jgi:vitamin B12 transporter
MYTHYTLTHAEYLAQVTSSLALTIQSVPLFGWLRSRCLFAGLVRPDFCPVGHVFFGIFAVIIFGLKLCRGPLAMACGLLVGALPSAWADGPDSVVTTLPEVVVTASRVPMRVDRSVAQVTVLGRADIERAAGHSLPELLAQQAGVQSVAYGGWGQASSIALRGLEGRHTLLLIDGVRYGSATLGTPVFDNLSLDQIERIEIVRGPMSSLYGSDAVGGVVQIFTRRGKPGFQANAGLSLGSHRYSNTHAGVGFGDARWDVAAQVAHLETRGFSATNAAAPFSFNPDDDGFRQHSGSLQVGLKLGGDWRLAARAFQARGVSSIDDGPDAEARARLRSEVLGLELEGSALAGWKTLTRIAQSTDRSTALSSASPFVTLGSFATKQLQLTRQDSVQTPWGEAVLVGEYLRQEVQTPDGDFPVRQRRVLGVSAGLQGQRAAHSWQGSVRHDRNSQFGHQNTGALGYGYDLTPQWRVGAALGSSFKAPSFNDLYYPQFGNPNLKPEQGKSLELSLRYVRAAHQVRAAFFEHRIKSYITANPSAFNVLRARVDGLSLTYEGKVADTRMLLSYEHLDAFNRDAGAGVGKLLPRRARNVFKAGVDRAFGAVSVGADMQALGQRFDDAANKTKLGGYTVLDLHAQWRPAAQWTVSAHLNNLGDKRYETAAGYNRPGREAYVSLGYALR